MDGTARSCQCNQRARGRELRSRLRLEYQAACQSAGSCACRNQRSRSSSYSIDAQAAARPGSVLAYVWRPTHRPELRTRGSRRARGVGGSAPAPHHTIPERPKYQECDRRQNPAGSRRTGLTLFIVDDRGYEEVQNGLRARSMRAHQDRSKHSGTR